MNGLCIQWGYGSSNQNVDMTITFPLQNQFTQKPIITFGAGNTSDTQEAWNYPLNIYSISTNGCKFCSKSSFNGARIYWIAMGY